MGKNYNGIKYSADIFNMNADDSFHIRAESWPQKRRLLAGDKANATAGDTIWSVYRTGEYTTPTDADAQRCVDSDIVPRIYSGSLK